MRLNLQTKRYAIAILFLFISGGMSGCAGSAPPLPPTLSQGSQEEVEASLNLTMEDKGLTCSELSSQERQVREGITVNEELIAGDRTKNQVAGYFGSFLLFPLVAVENNSDAKENLFRLQTRMDQIQYLQKLNACATA